MIFLISIFFEFLQWIFFRIFPLNFYFYLKIYCKIMFVCVVRLLPGPELRRDGPCPGPLGQRLPIRSARRRGLALSDEHRLEHGVPLFILQFWCENINKIEKKRFIENFLLLTFLVICSFFILFIFYFAA